MKTLLYLWRRHTMACLLNFMGIVLAVAGGYIILTQVIYSAQYNHGISGYQHICRVSTCGMFGEGKWIPTLPRPMCEYLTELPQVEEVAYMRTDGYIMADKDGSAIAVPCYVENGHTLSVFGAQRVDGTLTFEPSATGVVIPASLARKYFGREDVAGREMTFSYGQRCTVLGVYRDFPDNCLLRNAIYRGMGEENRYELGNWNYNCFIRLGENVAVETIPTLLDDFQLRFYEFWASAGGRTLSDEDWKEFSKPHSEATPLSETYFSGQDPETDKGNRKALYMLEFTLVLLFVVCVLNYANFSMAQAPMRVRSVILRKVMGESLWRLRVQMWTEGVAVSLLAAAVALFLVHLFSQMDSTATMFTGSILLADNLPLVASVLGVAVMVGLLSTAYSTRYVTSFAPVAAMKGRVGLSPQGRKLRGWLVGLQLCAALVMASFIGIIYSQSHYIYHSAYGYDKDSLLVSELADMVPVEKHASLRMELEKLPGVASVTYSMNFLGEGDLCMKWGRGSREQMCNFTSIPVDWKFLRTWGIEVVEGRDFREQDGDVYIVNEAMLQAYPWVKVDQPLVPEDLPVVGVCKNVRVFSTRMDNSNSPMAFVVFGPRYAGWTACRKMSVRMAPGVDMRQTRRQVEEVVTRFATGGHPTVHFYDKCLETAYKEENCFIRQIQLCSLLCILITLIGVFCLTMFETEYRRREIAIRKVMGSTVGEVLALFTGRYAWPLVVSMLIAAPVAYRMGALWLEGFAEHTPIHWWLFPVALIVVSSVVFVTVAAQCWRVATMNPMESIRTE
ncbi:MAG: FtsX-like permease family protein [Bacteroidaceae bacterium]